MPGPYAALATVEMAEATRCTRRRAMLSAGALLCVATGALLGGIALLALAVVPVAAMPAPWALAVVPGFPLVSGMALWLAQRRQAELHWFARLREQWALDQALMNDAARR